MADCARSDWAGRKYPTLSRCQRRLRWRPRRRGLGEDRVGLPVPASFVSTLGRGEALPSVPFHGVQVEEDSKPLAGRYFEHAFRIQFPGTFHEVIDEWGAGEVLHELRS